MAQKSMCWTLKRFSAIRSCGLNREMTIGIPQVGWSRHVALQWMV